MTDIVEFLVSESPEVRSKGEDLLKKWRSHVISELTTKLESKEPLIVGAAAYELGLVLSPWLRAKDSSSRFVEFTEIHVASPAVERPNGGPDASQCRLALQQAFVMLRAKAESPGANRALLEQEMRAVTATLGEVADDSTIDWALLQLKTVKDAFIAEPLFALCEAYCGIPPLFRAGRYCGLTTGEEMKRLMHEEAGALSYSLQQLSIQWQTLKPKTLVERIDHSIASWRGTIIPRMRTYSGAYHHEGWLDQEFAPLIRFGAPALPALKAQKDSEHDLGEKAVWEYFIAAISGSEDTAIVRQLMQGSDPQREMACEIIAASGSTRWLADLEQLKLVNGYHNGKASLVLAACHGRAAIPTLEKLHQIYPKEDDTRFVLQELKARSDGSPLRRRQW